MATRLNPYLNFRTSTRDAMTFYQSVFGGELSITTFADGGMPHEPAEAELIMHSQLTGGRRVHGRGRPREHGPGTPARRSAWRCSARTTSA